MALTTTTNLAGTIRSTAANGTLVNLPKATELLEIAIMGSGVEMARVCKGTKGVTPTPDTTKDSTIIQGTGYQAIAAEPESGGITSLLLYANNGESDLTYSINIIRIGLVSL